MTWGRIQAWPRLPHDLSCSGPAPGPLVLCHPAGPQSWATPTVPKVHGGGRGLQLPRSSLRAHVPPPMVPRGPCKPFLSLPPPEVPRPCRGLGASCFQSTAVMVSRTLEGSLLCPWCPAQGGHRVRGQDSHQMDDGWTDGGWMGGWTQMPLSHSQRHCPPRPDVDGLLAQVPLLSKLWSSCPAPSS